VVSAPVARTIAEMMIAVTEGHGTGVQAALDGFSVAGKTATAQKADPATGRYSLDAYVASFVGFVPAREPVLAIAVTLDEPGVNHQGGAVAAPVFRRVAQAALEYMGVTTGNSEPANLGQLAHASDPARAAYEVIRRARGQKPPIQEVHKEALGPGLVRVPDLTGFPLREALQRSVELGVKPRIVGTGLLSRQEPPPGATLKKGEALVMVFEPAT
jgi:cell division protein FtsI (penicillin-binding protein 3)